MTTEAGALKEWAREKADFLCTEILFVYDKRQDEIEAALLEGVVKGLEAARAAMGTVHEADLIKAVYGCGRNDERRTNIEAIDALLKDLKERTT